MKLYGHLCLKRTLLWSTSAAIVALDRGKIIKGVHKSEVATTIKYQDGSGQTRYKGSKHLKSTQHLGEGNGGFCWDS